MINNKTNIDISVIIVNYKTPKLLYDCINSIFKNQYGLTIEVIVVDNNSQDDSEILVKSNFPNVIWMDMKYNSGFSRANNAGIKIAKGNYILLLNSDTLIIGDCLKNTKDHYISIEKNNDKVGLLGCKIKDFNDAVLFNSSLSFPGIMKIIRANPIYIWLFRKKIPASEVTEKKRSEIHCIDHECKWVSAAFAFCNSNIFKNENLYMDEDFFMYFEDYEWCYRLIKRGYKNYFFPWSGNLPHELRQYYIKRMENIPGHHFGMALYPQDQRSFVLFILYFCITTEFAN